MQQLRLWPRAYDLVGNLASRIKIVAQKIIRGHEPFTNIIKTIGSIIHRKRGRRIKINPLSNGTNHESCCDIHVDSASATRLCLAIASHRFLCLCHDHRQMGNHAFDLCFARLVRILGWHRTQIQLIQHFLKQLSLFWLSHIRCQTVESSICFLCFGPVAIDTISGKKRRVADQLTAAVRSPALRSTSNR